MLYSLKNLFKKVNNITLEFQNRERLFFCTGVTIAMFFLCRWRVFHEFSGSQDCNGKLVAVHPYRLFILHSQPGSLPHRFPHGQHCSVREMLTLHLS